MLINNLISWAKETLVKLDDFWDYFCIPFACKFILFFFHEIIGEKMCTVQSQSDC
jgi:hypothetical protein